MRYVYNFGVVLCRYVVLFAFLFWSQYTNIHILVFVGSQVFASRDASSSGERKAKNN